MNNERTITTINDSTATLKTEETSLNLLNKIEKKIKDEHLTVFHLTSLEILVK